MLSVRKFTIILLLSLI